MELTKPGDLCGWRLTQGVRVDGACTECGHLIYLHAPDRACAACEAIAEAIENSAKAIAEAVTVGKQLLG